MTVIFLSDAVFYYSPKVDVTDTVVDYAQRFPPTINFPPSPRLGFKPIRLEDILQSPASR